jgi:hypothetical protein
MNSIIWNTKVMLIEKVYFYVMWERERASGYENKNKYHKGMRSALLYSVCVFVCVCVCMCEVVARKHNFSNLSVVLILLMMLMVFYFTFFLFPFFSHWLWLELNSIFAQHNDNNSTQFRIQTLNLTPIAIMRSYLSKQSKKIVCT